MPPTPTSGPFSCGDNERWNPAKQKCVPNPRPDPLYPPGHPGQDEFNPGGGTPWPGGGPWTGPGGPRPEWFEGSGRGRCAGLTGNALWACRNANNPETQTRMVPQTITDLLARFYTGDFRNYMNTGVLGTGVPEPDSPLLDLLLNRTFQNLFTQPASAPPTGPSPASPMTARPAGDPWGPSPAEANSPGGLTGTAPDFLSSVLGLSGGAAAYGYIDPSWKFDRSFRTVWNPVTTTILGQQPKKNKVPMDGLVKGGPAEGPVRFDELLQPQPCAGLTGQALWACRGRRGNERTSRAA